MYDLYEIKNLSAEEMRAYYRGLTGLDNDKEFTDDELHQYLLNTLKEPEDVFEYERPVTSRLGGLGNIEIVGSDKDMRKKLDDLLRGKEPSYLYMLLSRLHSDCEYYLGAGNRYAKNLWAEDEKTHIAYMKGIWESLPKDGKPEWLPYDKILEYEGKMCGVEVFFTFGSWEKYPFNMGYISITAPSVKMAIEEFRRNYPDINKGTLNCADYYYTEKSKAEIREHGNGAGCHRRIVVSSMDLTVDDLLADASARSGGAETAKSDIEIEK